MFRFSQLRRILPLAFVIQAPKDYEVLAIPLTAAALRVLTARKGTPDEWRQYLSSDYRTMS